MSLSRERMMISREQRYLSRKENHFCRQQVFFFLEVSILFRGINRYPTEQQAHSREEVPLTLSKTIGITIGIRYNINGKSIKVMMNTEEFEYGREILPRFVGRSESRAYYI